MTKTKQRVKTAFQALFALFVGLMAFTLSPAKADDYPTRTIKIVVPYAPGGQTDIMGRLAAHYLSERIGTSVIIENVPGGTTTVATQRVVQSAPDGYTLLVIGTDLLIQPLLRSKLGYDVSRDLVPIAMLGLSDLVYAVNAKSPAKTFGELVELARTKPGSLSFSTAGVGTLQHMSAEMLGQKLGVPLLHVPYRGAGPAAAAVIQGDTDFVVTGLVTIKGYIDGGSMRLLASDGKTRLSNMPNVPTLTELGYPELSLGAWSAIFAPSGIPDNIRERLVKEFTAVADLPEFRKRTEDIGVGGRIQENFENFIKGQTDTFRNLIEKNGSKFKIP